MFKIFESPLIRQYFVVITVNLSVLATGVGLVWPSPVLVKLRNGTETVLSRPITEDEGSWIVSIGFLTGMIANILAVFLVDRIGRKYTIILACLPKLIVGFILIYAREVWMILVARAIIGASDAFVFTVLPMYASEVASKEIRGALGTILQILCSIGVVTMLSMGPFTSYITLNVIYTAIIFATTIPLIFLPDSPYFLYSKGKNEKAFKVLTFLRGSEVLANEELKEYAVANTVKISKKELFKNKIFLKSFAILIILGLGGQLIGFNSISFYLQSILETTQTSVRPEVASVTIGLIQLFASFCTTTVTDRFGRKPILTSTLMGMAIGMIGLGTFFKLKENGPISGFLNFVPLISLILVVYCYSAGMGSITWVLTAELFDDPSRGAGMSMGAISSYAFMFLATKYFSLLIMALGPAATYWFFGVNCVLLCLFVMVCIPETKGKTFAEIQVDLGAKVDFREKDSKI